MKPQENDKELSAVLREWKQTTPLPPRFREGVWHRIQHTQVPAHQSFWDAIARWIGAALPRPAIAFSYVAILLVIGGTAGWTHGRHDTAHARKELAERYVQALDPYAAPRK